MITRVLTTSRHCPRRRRPSIPVKVWVRSRLCREYQLLQTKYNQTEEFRAAEQVYLLPTCGWKRAPGSHLSIPDTQVLPSLSSGWIQVLVGVRNFRPE